MEGSSPKLRSSVEAAIVPLCCSILRPQTLLDCSVFTRALRLLFRPTQKMKPHHKGLQRKTKPSLSSDKLLSSVIPYYSLRVLPCDAPGSIFLCDIPLITVLNPVKNIGTGFMIFTAAIVRHMILQDRDCIAIRIAITKK